MTVHFRWPPLINIQITLFSCILIGLLHLFLRCIHGRDYCWFRLRLMMLLVDLFALERFPFNQFQAPLRLPLAGFQRCSLRFNTVWPSQEARVQREWFFPDSTDPGPLPTCPHSGWQEMIAEAAAPHVHTTQIVGVYTTCEGVGGGVNHLPGIVPWYWMLSNRSGGQGLL